ncbi:MAG: hypothetical protein LBL83_12895, partial [Clostridiales bacterium]|nr:hypothetical protein [Clostridiales bacterium]
SFEAGAGSCANCHSDLPSAEKQERKIKQKPPNLDDWRFLSQESMEQAAHHKRQLLFILYDITGRSVKHFLRCK